MRRLHEEITVRFPEVRSAIFRGDEELPYVLIGHVAHWLTDLPKEAATPEVISRVQAFAKWCEEQPSGETAADDIYTIFIVGFYEKLFESDSGRAYLPKLASQKDLTRNAAYLKKWVGEANYGKAETALQKKPNQPPQTTRGKAPRV